ncbi:hypothetical protein QF001_001608 [Paraburkholderia youngii]
MNKAILGVVLRCPIATMMTGVHASGGNMNGENTNAASTNGASASGTNVAAGAINPIQRVMPRKCQS